MLVEAIKAGLPLISVYTPDTINVGMVLSEIAGKEAKEWSKLSPPKAPAPLQYCIGTPNFALRDLYLQIVASASSLVVVNPDKPDPLLFSTGVLPIPHSLRKRVVEKYYAGDSPAAMIQALNGLTYKEMLEVFRMTTVMHGMLTPMNVAKTRKSFLPVVQGLRRIEADVHYFPNKTLSDWMKLDGALFVQGEPKEIQPRGLLFAGEPGCGKTMGAKYVAMRLGVPLYHLDMSSLMSKYVGESEQNLQIALSQAEQLAPCVILMDEVEKLFTHQEDSGTTSRLLSAMLWWLQEHQARVLTIMTTNNVESIPPELHRPGRIDQTVWFDRLKGDAIVEFLMFLMKATYHLVPWDGGVDVNLMVGKLLSGKKSNFTHAEIVKEVNHEIKRRLVDTLT